MAPSALRSELGFYNQRISSFPEIFQKAIRGKLQDKVLFGTDFPYVDLEKALNSFEKFGLKDTVKEKILFSNSQALFGL